MKSAETDFRLQEPRGRRSSSLAAAHGSAIRFAYADPPYPGCAKLHYAQDPSGIAAEEVDHEKLLAELATFDAWALSTHSPALRWLLPMCPDDVRVGAWVKPFCSMRGQRIAYAWEPVIFRGARKKVHTDQLTARDWVSETPPHFHKKALGNTKGQKGQGFCLWLFDMMGLTPQDELVDLFPGSGAVTHFWEAWKSQGTIWPNA